MRNVSSLLAVAALVAVTGCADTQLGRGGSMAQGTAGVPGDQSAVGSPQIPRCNAPLGTVALVEDQTPALAQHGLSSPIPVLRLMISQSGCFNVVDRGEALTRIQQEERLTGRPGARRQLVGAQYFLTPQIVVKDQNAGGMGGGLGGLLPGRLGFLGSAVGYQASEAQTVLYLTQTSSGMQVAAAEGSAQTRDWSLGGFGFGGGVGGALGGYSSTAIGKTVTAALVDAYSKLVRQIQASKAG